MDQKVKKNNDKMADQQQNVAENGRSHGSRVRSKAPNSVHIHQSYDIDSVIEDHNNNSNLQHHQQRGGDLTLPSIISVDTSEMLSKTASVVEQAIEEQTEQLEDFTMTNADQRKFSNDIKPNSSIVKQKEEQQPPQHQASERYQKRSKIKSNLTQSTTQGLYDSQQLEFGATSHMKSTGPVDFQRIQTVATPRSYNSTITKERRDNNNKDEKRYQGDLDGEQAAKKPSQS